MLKNPKSIFLLVLLAVASAFSTISISTDYRQIVAIDIKPGSFPNCFNINGSGVVPVAILGSDDFDVGQIDHSTLSFGGLSVRMRGNKGPLCAIEYSNGDDYLDLACRFEDDPSNWSPDSDDEATVTGELFDGTMFEGTDSICVKPDPGKGNKGPKSTGNQ